MAVKNSTDCLIKLSWTGCRLDWLPRNRKPNAEMKCPDVLRRIVTPRTHRRAQLGEGLPKRRDIVGMSNPQNGM